MLRTVNYTLSSTESSPKARQFAGIQGENLATNCVFTPDTGFAAALAAAAAEYDRLMVRFDCIDGLGRAVIGTPQTYTTGAVSFALGTAVTEAGGTLKITVCFSGETTGSSSSTVLYSFPVLLYFENFPLRQDLTDRENLNQAVLTCKTLRDETYTIAAGALSTKQEIDTAAAAVRTDKTTCTTAAQTAQSASAAATQSATAAQTAQTGAAASAASAQTAATSAASSLSELLAVVGNINSVLATVVNG